MLLTPTNPYPVPIRSTGASIAIGGLAPVVTALATAGPVVGLTIEGLMHAANMPAILLDGARTLTISNERTGALERFRPDPALETVVRTTARALRAATAMYVTSPAGTDLRVDLMGANTVGVWGWTAKPGSLAHWPGGLG